MGQAITLTGDGHEVGGTVEVGGPTLAEFTIGQIVAGNPERARVFEKLGIDYCCGGKKRLDAVCQAQGLDAAQVTEEIAAVDAAHPAAGVDWTRASLAELTDHIVAAHHDYLRAELPRLSYLTGRVKNAHGAKYPALVELDAVFNKLRAELEAHTAKEEAVLFPFIKQLEQNDAPTSGFSVSQPIAVMEAEHDEAGDALADIRQLTDDFTPPSDTCNTHRVLLASLQELENNMHHHVHKENSILFPRAIAREKELAVGS
jgi:regulator of cell morphogenesis and NO signaling